MNPGKLAATRGIDLYLLNRGKGFPVTIVRSWRTQETISWYTRDEYEIHGLEAGSVLTIDSALDGQSFTDLNGGPVVQFNQSVSFQVFCDTPKEIDYYWSSLCEGGEELQFGWRKDRFGLSWQIVPAILP